MCIRDSDFSEAQLELITGVHAGVEACVEELTQIHQFVYRTVSYTHLRAHETVLDLVCRLLLEKKKPTYTTHELLRSTITNNHRPRISTSHAQLNQV